MQINADFTQPALVHPSSTSGWPPQAGVERIMLDRTGAERGRPPASCYAPDSRFPHHQHPAGEEILVLSGVFPRATTTTHRAGTCATRRAQATPRTALRAP